MSREIFSLSDHSPNIGPQDIMRLSETPVYVRPQEIAEIRLDVSVLFKLLGDQQTEIQELRLRIEVLENTPWRRAARWIKKVWESLMHGW